MSNDYGEEWSAAQFLRDPDFRHGYEDRKAGRPWPREYDDLYEAGRHYRAAGGRLNTRSFFRHQDVIA